MRQGCILLLLGLPFTSMVQAADVIVIERPVDSYVLPDTRIRVISNATDSMQLDLQGDVVLLRAPSARATQFVEFGIIGTSGKIAVGEYTGAYGEWIPILGLSGNSPAVGMEFGNTGSWDISTCPGSSGSVEINVLDISYDIDGNPTSLAVDFSIPCNEMLKPIRVSLRFNSPTPLSGLSQNIVIADAPAAKPGETVELDSLAANGYIPVSGNWTQLSGPALTLDQSGSANSHVQFSAVPAAPGGETVVLQYTAEDAGGNQASAYASIPLINADDPRNHADLVGSPGEATIGDQHLVLNEPLADSPSGTGTSDHFEGQFLAGSQWQVYLSAGSGGTLSPGSYSIQRNNRYGDLSLPYFELRRDATICSGNLSGNFDVNAYSLDESGFLKSLDVDFTQTCDDTGATLSGTVQLVPETVRDFVPDNVPAHTNKPGTPAKPETRKTGAPHDAHTTLKNSAFRRLQTIKGDAR